MIKKYIRLIAMEWMKIKKRDPQIKRFIKYHRRTKDVEIQEMIRYMKKHNQFSMMNCELACEYNPGGGVTVYWNSERQPYVLHEGQKLYFPQNKNEKQIKETYVALLREQDANSPHRYLAPADLEAIKRYKAEGKYIRVFEFGAAEGMFSLKLCPFCDEIHIFECDSNWIEALRCTFAPWKDKVYITEKYVSDYDDAQHVSLDCYLSQRQKAKGLDIVKMDIEGSEIMALKGMKHFMQDANNFMLFVCTYHRQGDEEAVRDICKDYRIEANKGYFCFYVDPEYGEPYVRRCLLKVTK